MNAASRRSARILFKWVQSLHSTVTLVDMPNTLRGPELERFARIGELFTVYGSPLHIGAVVASHDAIYLIASQEPFGFKSLFTGKLGHPLTAPTAFLPRPLSALDSAVTTDPSWPLQTCSGFVLALTKNDVIRVHKPLFGALTITTIKGYVKIRKGISQRFPAAQTLANFGWPCSKPRKLS